MEIIYPDDVDKSINTTEQKESARNEVELSKANTITLSDLFNKLNDLESRIEKLESK